MKRNLLTILAGLLAVTACGGDGETVAGIDGRGTPVAATVVSKGTISGFGSVIVNGPRTWSARSSAGNAEGSGRSV